MAPHDPDSAGSEANHALAANASGPPAGPPPPTARRVATVLALCTVPLLVASLVLVNFKDSSVYAKGVDQILKDRSRWTGRAVRMEGTLVKHSLQFHSSPCEYQFDVTRAGETVRVVYPSCIKPDTLRDDMPDVGVTAEGKLLATGQFQATTVFAKCPSKYEMKDKAQGFGSAWASSGPVL